MKYVYGQKLSRFRKNLTSVIASAAILANSMGVALPFLLSKPVAAAPATEIVTPTNLNGWVKYGTATPGYTFESDPTAPLGNGALKLETINGSEYIQLDRALASSSTPVLASDINLSYSTKRLAGAATAAPAYVLAIDKDGNLNDQSDTFWAWFEPTYNDTGSEDYNNWNTWNLTASSRFWFNGAKPAEAVNYTHPLSEVLVSIPNAIVTGFTLNMGTGNPGMAALVDKVVTTEATYNFEQDAVPIVNGENFNTHNDSGYKGINVGFNIADFGEVSSVSVSLYKNDDLLVTNTHNATLLSLINGGATTLSTPFIIQNGTYVEEYWNLGSFDWTVDTKPTKAIVTVTGTNGTESVELTSLNEGGSSWPTYLSLLEQIVKPSVNKTVYKGESLELEVWSFEAQVGGVQWAVRYNTCSAGSGTVAGNVDGFSNSSSWLGGVFTASVDTASFTNIGDYCFVFNPTQGNRLTRTFSIVEVPDTTKPTISITPDAPLTLSGTQSFEVTITDDNPLDPTKNKDIWVELYGVPNQSDKKGQKVNLSSGTGTFTIDTTTLPDGKYVLRVGSVQDAAGNTSGDKSFKYFTIDNTQPVIEFITPVASSTVSGLVTIQARIIEEGSGLNYVWVKFVDGANPNQFGAVQMHLVAGETDIYEAQIDTTLYNGVYALGIDVADNAGNGRSAKAQNITVDNTAPSLSNIVMYVNGVAKKFARPGDIVRITVDAVDAASGIDKIQLWVRDWPYTGKQITAGNMTHVSGDTYEFVFTLPSTYSDGSPINQTFEGNYFNFRPYDTAGNSHIGWRTNFTVDNVRPTITVNTLHNSINPTVLSVTAADNLRLNQVTGHVYNETNTTLIKNCSINVASLNTNAYTHTCNISTMGLSDGVYTIRANASDMTSWLSITDSSVQFIIDYTKPEIDITNVTISSEGKLSFNLEATDNASGLEIVAANIYDETNTTKLIELGNGSPTRLNTPHSGLPIRTNSFDVALDNIDVSSLPNGIYTVRGYAKDHAGNELRFKLVKFTVNNPQPTVLGENFNTHSGTDYKGINVGFRVSDFQTVTGVTVDLYHDGDSTPFVSNTHNDELLALIGSGTSQLSTPFITSPGTYTEQYWNLGTYLWNPASLMPIKAVVTVTGTNSAGQSVTESVEISPLDEGSPSWPTFASVLPVAIQNNFGGTGGFNNPAPQTLGVTNTPTNSDGSNPAPTARNASAQSNSAVLAAETENTDPNVSEDDMNRDEAQAELNEAQTLAAGDESEESDSTGCSKILGICWYWWIPIVVVILGTIFYMTSRRAEEK